MIPLETGWGSSGPELEPMTDYKPLVQTTRSQPSHIRSLAWWLLHTTHRYNSKLGRWPLIRHSTAREDSATKPRWYHEYYELDIFHHTWYQRFQIEFLLSKSLSCNPITTICRLFVDLTTWKCGNLLCATGNLQVSHSVLLRDLASRWVYRLLHRKDSTFLIGEITLQLWLWNPIVAKQCVRCPLVQPYSLLLCNLRFTLLRCEIVQLEEYQSFMNAARYGILQCHLIKCVRAILIWLKPARITQAVFGRWRNAKAKSLPHPAFLLHQTPRLGSSLSGIE
jgi:hypothetical protein